MLRVGFVIVVFVKISSQRLSPILQNSLLSYFMIKIAYWLTIIAQELAMSKYQMTCSKCGGTQTMICSRRKIHILNTVCSLMTRNKQINIQRVVLCMITASPIYLKTPIINFFDFYMHTQHFPFVVSSFWKLDLSEAKTMSGYWISGLRLLYRQKTAISISIKYSY